MSSDPVAAARSALGPDGPLAAALSGYEARSAQLEMAGAVAAALAEERVLLVEAGTGTGKTLAYLVPTLQSGRKVVISTATRALEEQLVHGELPLVSRALGVAPSVAVMKGLTNYVCRRRYAEFAADPAAAAPRLGQSLRVFDDWLGRTATGDVAELTELSEDDPLLSQVTAASETRIGPGCPYHETCFVTAMRRAAEQARVVIVNHHLFFADLALRGPHPGRVIPDYEAVVFDEAHQLEEVATHFFGHRVSRSRLTRLGQDIERSLERARALEPGLVPRASLALAADLGSVATSFFNAVGLAAGHAEPRIAVERDLWTGEPRDRWLELDQVLEGIAALATSASDRLRTLKAAGPGSSGALADGLEIAARRAGAIRDQLAAIVDAGRGTVAWFEPDAQRPVLSAAPVDLAAVFRVALFERVPTAVLTSATLTTGWRRGGGGADGVGGSLPAGDFSYLRARLGLVEPGLEVQELVLGSPFDFESAVLLYLPRDLPAPGEAGFIGAAAQRIVELVTLTDGGAFVLTTSLRSLRQLGAALRAALPGHRVLAQGDAPKAALLASFRAEQRAVLVATMGFWEGVDVPGQALRLVILEKVPFAVPSDPVVRARALALEKEGKNPFTELFVPAAALTLKQGFGRLVRTRRDRGVVALLDGRVMQRGYGRRLLDALPPARRTTELDAVRDFVAAELRLVACV